VRLAS
jgi:hypothetical protein